MRTVIAVGMIALASQAAAQSQGYEEARAALSDCAETAIAAYSSLDLPLLETADMVVTKCGPALDHAVDEITQGLSDEEKQIARGSAIHSFRNTVRVRLADAKVDGS